MWLPYIAFAGLTIDRQPRAFHGVPTLHYQQMEWYARVAVVNKLWTNPARCILYDIVVFTFARLTENKAASIIAKDSDLKALYGWGTLDYVKTASFAVEWSDIHSGKRYISNSPRFPA